MSCFHTNLVYLNMWRAEPNFITVTETVIYAIQALNCGTHKLNALHLMQTGMVIEAEHFHFAENCLTMQIQYWDVLFKESITMAWSLLQVPLSELVDLSLSKGFILESHYNVSIWLLLIGNSMFFVTFTGGYSNTVFCAFRCLMINMISNCVHIVGCLS